RSRRSRRFEEELDGEVLHDRVARSFDVVLKHASAAVRRESLERAGHREGHSKRILIVRSRHRWLAERELPRVTASRARAVARGIEDVREGEVEDRRRARRREEGSECRGWRAVAFADERRPAVGPRGVEHEY